jgi:ATP:ADP antiporter, AAA family
VGQFSIGRATRDTLFLSAFDVHALPAVLMGAAALSVISVLGFSRLLGVHSPARVVPAAIVASQLSLLGAWGLSFGAPRLAALAVYGHVAVFGGALVSGSWSLVNERFDPRTGKRLVGWITTGGLSGAVLGALLAWATARVIAVPAMLLVMVAINGLALAGVIVVGRSTPALPTTSLTRDESPASGFRTLRETPYLRGLALVVGLSALTEALLDYVLNAEAGTAYATGTELMSFFALFYLAVAGVGLLLQLTVAERFLVAGLVRSISLKPGAVLVGGILGTFAPGLWVAASIRGVPAVLHNSIYRSGYELLFTPLPERQKRPAKALIDVGVDKLGAFLGGGTALLVVSVAPDVASRVLCLLAAAVGGLVLLTCRGLQSGYVGTLEANLRSRAVSVARASASGAEAGALAPELELDSPLMKRIAALRSGSARLARAAMREPLEAALVAPVIDLLERDDLAREAVAALRVVAPRTTGQLCDALLDPTRPVAVRRRVPRVLKACSSQRSADGLCLGLQDGRFEVRYECGAALARIAERGSAVQVRAEVVNEAVMRELGPGELGVRVRKHVFNLLSVCYPREPLRLSYWALQPEQSEDAVRGTALEYLEHMLPDHVRRALLPLLDPMPVRRAGPRSQEDRLRELSQASSASVPVPEEPEDDPQ